MQKKEYSVFVDDKNLIAVFSDLADQANGSVMVRYGDTVVFATAVMSEKEKEGSNFFPLTVDLEEKFYAVGKILGNRFQKREGRPTEKAILCGRIVDRTVRPLFDHDIRHDVQVIITVLSVGDEDPDILGVLAASLAIGTSDIPWNGPVSAIRIGKKKNDSSFLVNPTNTIRNGDNYELDLVACGNSGKINMIEIAARETKESDVMAGLKIAVEEIEKIQEFQKKIIAEIGKKKREVAKKAMPEEVAVLFQNSIGEKIRDYIFSGTGKEKIKELEKTWETAYATLPEEHHSSAKAFLDAKINDILHAEIILNGRRPDGRAIDEIRSLYAEAGGISPVHHGAGIFYRGGTHILSVLTLGGPGDKQIIEGMESIAEGKRFMHHYNFPPFGTGETGKVGGANRRMIGHGALAEKALLPVIPPKEEFPYTIRIVSESMASNGSTSMGSVCAGTLALMDAGVPIKNPVAGIASGLMMISPDKYRVLTDIQGPEDYHGDMDFKVAGTRNGVTAAQMDVKVDGIPLHILEEAFLHAKKARFQILDVIEKAIAKPRPTISPNAPEIAIVKIKTDQIGLIIGPGGKTVNGIREKTGTEIDIEDDGTVFITGKNGSAKKAAAMVQELTREYKKGEKLHGIVTKIAEFGAFVRIGPNTEGLLHISEIAPFRINKIEDVLKTGDTVFVIIKDIDERNRIKLSIKDINPNFVKKS